MRANDPANFSEGWVVLSSVDGDLHLIDGEVIRDGKNKVNADRKTQAAFLSHCCGR